MKYSLFLLAAITLCFTAQTATAQHTTKQLLKPKHQQVLLDSLTQLHTQAGALTRTMVRTNRQLADELRNDRMFTDAQLGQHATTLRQLTEQFVTITDAMTTWDLRLLNHSDTLTQQMCTALAFARLDLMTQYEQLEYKYHAMKQRRYVPFHDVEQPLETTEQ